MISCRLCTTTKRASSFSDRQLRKHTNALNRKSATTVQILCLDCAVIQATNNTTSSLLFVPPPFNCYLTVLPTPSNLKSLENGLQYSANFLTPAESLRIMNVIDSNTWEKKIKRRQQFYGEVYYHTTSHNESLQPSNSNPNSNPIIPLDLSQFSFLIDKFVQSPEFSPIFGGTRDSFPSQILVNEYIGMNGIAAHFEDEEAFGPVIATISLLSPTLMILTKPKVHDNDCEGERAKRALRLTRMRMRMRMRATTKLTLHYSTQLHFVWLTLSLPPAPLKMRTISLRSAPAQISTT